ncbi:MAG: hypothetical protein ACREK6_01555 [Candidatus Rokuibacteriota bacterium]
MSKKAVLIALGMVLISAGSVYALRTDERGVPAPRGEERPEDIQAPRGERPEDIQAPRGAHIPA